MKKLQKLSLQELTTSTLGLSLQEANSIIAGSGTSICNVNEWANMALGQYDDLISNPLYYASAEFQNIKESIITFYNGHKDDALEFLTLATNVSFDLFNLFMDIPGLGPIIPSLIEDTNSYLDSQLYVSGSFSEQNWDDFLGKYSSM